MSHDEDQNTQDYSQATLSSLSQAKNLAVLSARPPLWLIFCTSMLVAITTLNMYYDPDSIRRVVAIGTMLLYWLTWWIYCYLLRKKGIRVRAIPRSFTGKMFVLSGGIFYILVIIIAAAFLDQGVQSAPYLAALVNGVSWAIVTHRYPTGEWTRGESQS